MRSHPSYAERIMWIQLRNKRLNGYKFRRQHIIGCYIVDFVCLRKKIILELDGDFHNSRKSYDAKRTRYLVEQGFKVYRMTNEKLLGSGETMFDELIEMLEQR